MTTLPPNPLVTNPEAIPGQNFKRPLLILTAWLAMLLMSKLPLVMSRELFLADIPWITPAWIGASILFFALTFVWPALVPLRGFFVVMGVIFLVTTLLDPWIARSAAWQSIFEGAAPLIVLFGERVLIAIEALIVLGALFLMGLKRRDVFLTTGDLNAPVDGKSMNARKKPVSWMAFGSAMALLLSGLFFAFMASQNPQVLSSFTAAIPWLPVVLVSAALNAFGEEAMYRAAPLAVLLPAVGPKHALWLTAIWFGLGHYYGGIPSGPIGFVQSGLLALLLGKAMLDTRGIGWPWIIHLALDTVIYMMIAMQVVARL